MDEIVAALGARQAQALVEEFGGMRVYIPVVARPADRISEAVGLDAATALSRRFGGEKVDIPNPSARRKRIIALHAAGVADQEIARQLGCTQRWVQKVLHEHREYRTA